MYKMLEKVKGVVQEPRGPGSSVEGRLNRSIIPPRPSGLPEVSLAHLTSELLARIRDGVLNSEGTVVVGCQIQDALQVALDIHLNRLSRRHYRDMYGVFYEWVEPIRPTLDGATIVELGCGSINPFGLLFLFLMVGARRCIAVDLDDIQDISRAVKAAAECAGMMLVDPKQLVGDYPITREQVLQNIASFDLAKLHAGDSSGIDVERLSYLQEPLEALTLQDGVADLIISNATLEHIDILDDTIGEMARITRKGGFGIHNIDGADHRRYWDPAVHPLEFLTVACDKGLVHGSNRIRPAQFGPLFERHGFEVMSFLPHERVDIDTALRKRFAEPFRSMSNQVLTVIGGKLVVRRR